jgi:hypothetical protein
MIEAEGGGKPIFLEDTLEPWLRAICNSALVKRFVNEIQQQRIGKFHGGNEVVRNHASRYTLASF